MQTCPWGRLASPKCCPLPITLHTLAPYTTVVPGGVPSPTYHSTYLSCPGCLPPILKTRPWRWSPPGASLPTSILPQARMSPSVLPWTPSNHVSDLDSCPEMHPSCPTSCPRGETHPWTSPECPYTQQTAALRLHTGIGSEGWRDTSTPFLFPKSWGQLGRFTVTLHPNAR